jgi:hypothetical protein
MKKSTKIRLVVGALLLIFVFTIMISRINSKEDKKVYDVKVEGISIANSLDTTYSTNGNLELCNNKIHAVAVEYNSIIEDIYVENGEKITEGQQLLKVKKLSDNTESTLASEYAGVVKFSKEIHIGTILSQYTTVLTINQLTCAEDFYVKVQVPSSVYSNMSTINSADVTFPDLISEVNLNGVLANRSIVAEQKSNVDYYDIYISVEDTDLKLQDYNLIEGMGVDVTLHSKNQLKEDTGTISGYYEVPFSAVVMRDNKNVVFVYEKKGLDEHTAHMVFVDLINTNGDTAVIRVSGTYAISKNSRLITEGNYNLSGSETVKAQ